MAGSLRSIRPPIKYPTEQELEAARQRGREALAEEPHVVAAVYDAKKQALSLRFAPEHALLVIEDVRDSLPELRDLSDAELETVEVVDSGGTLLWDKPDVAVGVAALAMRFLGTREIRRAALREIAATSSPRKAEAARENGTLGGRPRYTMARKAATAEQKKSASGRKKSAGGRRKSTGGKAVTKKSSAAKRGASGGRTKRS